ncbi:MAG: response regulator [Caldilineaceae bacterium]|nr:response regulator [Caldilineaceae bacterium]
MSGSDYSKALVIDDDDQWQQLLGNILAESGYTCEFADDYSRAHDRILHSESYISGLGISLCIVDLRLAGSDIVDNFDGLGLLAVCRVAEIPTIVVSAYVNHQLTEQLKTKFGVLAAFNKGAFNSVDFRRIAIGATLMGTYLQTTGSTSSETSSTEFRHRIQALSDTVMEYYSESYRAINQRARERNAILSNNKLASDDEKWKREVEELTLRHKQMMQQIAAMKSISEVESTQNMILQECMTWQAGFII